MLNPLPELDHYIYIFSVFYISVSHLYLKNITIIFRSCDEVHYIPEYVQSNFPHQHVRQINNKLIKAIKEMETLLKQYDRLDDNEEKNKANCKK